MFNIEFSRDIVARKVTAQAGLLREAMTTRHDLRLPLKTATDTLEKVINSIHTLCYTLLHFELVRETEVIGLDPTIGFYHQFEYGRESLFGLALDISYTAGPEIDLQGIQFLKEVRKMNT